MSTAYENLDTLVTFLKEHDALDKYCNNIQYSFSNNYILGAVINLPVQNLIAEAFSWRDTPEGYAYWAHIDKNWVEDYIKPMIMNA